MGALVCMILSSLGGLMTHPLKVLSLPAVCTPWGEGLIQIRVTGNSISSTLNGQIDNIFHRKLVINPYWLSSEHNNGITRKLYFSDNYAFT